MSTVIAPVFVRIIKVASSSALQLINRIKPKISAGDLPKFQRSLIAGDCIVPAAQPSGLAGLKAIENPNC